MVERSSVMILLFLLVSCLPKAGPAILEIKSVGIQHSPEFQALTQTVLTDKCIGCHANLETEAGLKRMIGTGPWEGSKFYTFLRDGVMPPGNPLSAQEMEVVTVYLNAVFDPAPIPEPAPEPEPEQEPLPEETKVTYLDLRDKILGKCIACHKGASTEEGLMKWVDQANPMASKLLKRTEDKTMPKGGTPLSPEELDLIRNYLQQFSDTSVSSAEL